MKSIFCVGVALSLWAAMPSLAETPPVTAPVAPSETEPEPAPAPPVSLAPSGYFPRGLTQAEAKARLAPSQLLPLTSDLKPLIAQQKNAPVKWQKFPGPDDLERYMPKAARKAQVRGVVLASCDWNAEGAITDCKILEETPAEYGYGKATRALLMATGIVMQKPGLEGTLKAGEGLPVILRWEWSY